MSIDNKFIIMNKLEDFQECVLENLTYNNKELLKLTEENKSGKIISNLMDSEDSNNTWHLWEVNLDGNDYYLKTYIFTSDEDFVELGQNKVLIEDFIRDESISFNKKLEFFKENYLFEFTNDSKKIIHNLRGRYLWFVSEIQLLSNLNIEIRDFRVYFPLESFIKYFPNVYQKNELNNDFFIRFVAIFQELYMEIEERIDNKFIDFIPEKLSKERILKLLSIFGLGYINNYKREVLEGILVNINSILRLKGTISGLKLLIDLLISKKAHILEYDDVYIENLNIEMKKNLVDNFGDSIDVFTVFIDDSLDISSEEKSNLVQVIDNYIPVTAGYKIYFVDDFYNIDIYKPIDEQIKREGKLLGHDTVVPLKI